MMSFWIALALLPSLTRAADGIDPEAYLELKALVKPYLYELKKPIYVYNWHEAGPGESLSPNDQDPVAYQSLVKFSGRYWEKRPENTQGAYGTGLYVAIDPVESRSYGGTSPRWVLTEIRLPEGFRVLDLGRDGASPVPMQHTSLIDRLGCPKEWKNEGLLHNLFKETTNGRCLAAIQKLFREDFQLDGFSYAYSGASFAGCESRNLPAFVVTSGKKLSPNNVRILNRQTQGDENTRARIQALFRRSKSLSDDSAEDGPTVGQIQAQMKKLHYEAYFSWLPNRVVGNSVRKGGNISWNVRMCDKNADKIASAGKATKMSLNCIVVPVTLSQNGSDGDGSQAERKDPATFSRRDRYTGEMLWDDLEGKPFPKDLTSWMKQNLYACAKENLYRQVRKPVKRHYGEAEDGEGAPAAEDTSGSAQ